MVKGEIIEITEATFEQEIVKSKLPAIVDFWADWCDPCKALVPTMQKISVEYSGKVKVVKVNIEKNTKIAQTYDIRSIPTLLFFKRGKVVGQLVGTVSKAKIGEAADRMLKQS
jgi:thioredoxin 1